MTDKNGRTKFTPGTWLGVASLIFMVAGAWGGGAWYLGAQMTYLTAEINSSKSEIVRLRQSISNMEKNTQQIRDSMRNIELRVERLENVQ